MKVNILGSGTSSGIPVPGCICGVCKSGIKKNNRLRTSILVQLYEHELSNRSFSPLDNQIPVANILVDTSPDLRYQSLRAGISSIDAVLYTHTHADHVFGIDDLRSFNFVNHRYIPLFASDSSAKELEERFPYAFFDNPSYEGGTPPMLKLSRIEPYKPLELFGFEIIPLLLLHGKMPVLGYRFKNFAYLTDCSLIPEKSYDFLKDLDTLVIDGLRYRPHKTHFTHEQAVKEIERINPKQSYLTHISHEVDHDSANEKLKLMTNCKVELAYDGLIIET